MPTRLLLTLLAATLCWCGQPENPVLRIARTSAPPSLSSASLEQTIPAGTKVEEFRQRHPADGEPASQSTTAFLSYDARNLYVLFVCTDESGKVNANLSRRDDIVKDDYVGIALDTFHDRRRFYRFSANPLGVQRDAIGTEGRDDDLSFDAVWHSEGRLTSSGYVVLIAIPFKTLRFPQQSEQRWGIALFRSIPRANEVSYWPPISQKVEGLAQQFATLEGLAGITPARNWQFIPYGFLGHSQFLDSDRSGLPRFLTSSESRIGLDAKVVLRNALTLDVALNPDFSQVESDEPQVTVNQRYEVFFPERRPFFTENAAFLQTPEDLFYSRRVADPTFGARLTGKSGPWAIGALFAGDRAPGRRLAQEDPLYGQQSLIAAGSISREFASQSRIGVLATDYEFGANANRVLSFDTRLKFSENWVAVGQAVLSHSRGAGAVASSGTDLLARVSRSGLHLNYEGQYRERSPHFEAQLGFIPRVDMRQTTQSMDYTWRPTHGSLKAIQLYGGAEVVWNYDNRLQDLIANPVLQFEWAGGTFLLINRVDAFERYLNLNFRKSRTDVTTFVQRPKWMYLVTSYSAGTDINYDASAGVRPTLGNLRQARVDATFRPKSRLRFQQIWLYTSLKSRGPQPDSLFQNHIFRTQLNYRFTRALALRGIVDYAAVLPNSARVNLENTRRLGTDVLFSYQLHPGTAVFLGYGDQRENLSLGPLPVYRSARPDTVTGRQVFVKISYRLPM